MTDTPLMLRSDDVRQHYTVTGVVQGVGFRPFVHRIATELGLAGFVGNDSGAVFLEVQGDGALVAEFGRRLRAQGGLHVAQHFHQLARARPQRDGRTNQTGHRTKWRPADRMGQLA